jgi:D-alanyl-D-alanine carboxypeptidase/D-alanyl-D-alanine-endopeptidase (penicillin-binding protein 4)
MRIVWPIVRWGIAVLVVVLAGAAGLGGYAGVRHLRQPAALASSTPPPPDRALADATVAPSASVPTAGPRPAATRIAAVLRPPLADPHLGKHVLAEVRDVATGAVLFAQGGTTPAAPASTAKLATAIAVLSVYRPTDRFPTRVVAGAQPGTVVLVGGGDPTLTAAAPGHDGAYSDAARISDLVRQLHGVRRVEVDGRLFTGAGVSPYWAPEDVPSDYASPITAAMVDGGRDTPTARIRSTSPDLAAGRALAAALHLPASAVTRGAAPAGAQTLASVQSAPVATLVTQMLLESDNVIAECLARQVALAEHQPASFAGAAAGVRLALAQLGASLGTGMVDGSGLAARDRLTPDTLTRVLLVAGRRTDVLDMLPVAAWSGTLADRYVSGTARAGAGVVRAKTGTLTSVSTLSGMVQDEGGRLLAFALMADRVGPTEADTDAAEAALDRVAGTLASCGC